MEPGSTRLPQVSFTFATAFGKPAAVRESYGGQRSTASSTNPQGLGGESIMATGW